MTDELLTVSELKVHFPVRAGVFRRQTATVHAVDGVSFTLRRGETLGLVGESGCGKSTVARAVLRLAPSTGGTVAFEGRDMGALGGGELRKLRREAQIVFQDPLDSLNARHTVGAILAEPFRVHGIGTRATREAEVRGLLDRVGLPAAAVDKFPHEFSGGQRQRIGIARAIALKPKLIVCDEPVSALDVSVQSQVLNLLLDLQQSMGLAYLFIAHGLAVVKHMSDRIAVMYLGRIVELAQADDLYEAPLHPYTRALMAAIPVVGRRGAAAAHTPGEVPSPLSPPSGCHFHPRCPHKTERCAREVPAPRQVRVGRESRLVRCHFAGEL